MTNTNNLKRLATVLAGTAMFALSACGSSDDASENATADNVEMPADDMPSAEPSAAAAPVAPAADASQAALSAEAAAQDDADKAVSVAEEAKAAAAEAQAAKAQ